MQACRGPFRQARMITHHFCFLGPFMQNSGGDRRIMQNYSSTTTTAYQVSATPLILRLDVTGQPLRWIPWRDAVVLDTRSMIAWNAGDHVFTFRGGFNRISGAQSTVSVSSIIAVKGRLKDPGGHRGLLAGL